MLADGLWNHDPNAESRVELMSGGEVLGTALLTWLRNMEDEIEVARRVVKELKAGYARIVHDASGT